MVLINFYLMIIIMFCTINIYYLASIMPKQKVSVNNYRSEEYLFVVAQNVSYLKRFAGL